MKSVELLLLSILIYLTGNAQELRSGVVKIAMAFITRQDC